MSFRKSLAALAALAMVSTAALSVPALAQDSDEENDASLWVAGVGIVGAAVLGIVLATRGHEERQPVSA